MRVDLKAAKRLLGLEPDAPLRDATDWERVHNAAKSQIVEARRAGDDALAARISEAQATLKKSYGTGRKCPKCGEPKKPHARHCGLCSRAIRSHFHNRLFMDTTKDYEISETTLIPPINRGRSELRSRLRVLKVGDSFPVSNTSVDAISRAARLERIQVITRTVAIDPRSPKKRTLRVWRSDGMDEEKLNALIASRRAPAKAA